MSKPAPEDFIPEFRRKKLDEDEDVANAGAAALLR